MEWPNLQTVAISSFVGSLLVGALSSDEIQKFAFSAAVGYVSNYKGYAYTGMEPPKNSLLWASIITGYLGTHPIYGHTKTSIVVGALIVPIYEIYELFKSLDSGQQDADTG